MKFGWNSSSSKKVSTNSGGLLTTIPAGLQYHQSLYTYGQSTTAMTMSDYTKTDVQRVFSKYFPILKEFSQKEPTLSELTDVYLKIITDITETISFEKQKARNEAIFDLLKGNSTFYLIHAKSEDRFVSILAQLFIDHIPI